LLDRWRTWLLWWSLLMIQRSSYIPYHIWFTKSALCIIMLNKVCWYSAESEICRRFVTDFTDSEVHSVNDHDRGQDFVIFVLLRLKSSLHQDPKVEGG
jgi:hypothetical protein